MISISNKLSLSQVTPADKDALMRYLNDQEVNANTLTVPSPYRTADADAWIQEVERQRKRYGRLTNWAIRNEKQELIGGIGFLVRYGIASHKDEIGYWLAKPYRNQGLMTQVVQKICQIGKNERGLKRVEAFVFVENLASMKVLEKSGFVQEGVLHDYLEKNGELRDVVLYAWY